MLGKGRQHAVALEHWLVRCSETRQLIEVVHNEHSVEPGGLCRFGLRRDVGKDVGLGHIGVGEVRDLIAESGHAGTPGLLLHRLEFDRPMLVQRSSQNLTYFGRSCQGRAETGK